MKTPLPKVHIRGMALDCALGRGVHACVQGLAEARVNTVEVELSGFNEPVKMPYYRIPDSASLLDPARFNTLIPAIAADAVKDAGLSAEEIKDLPIFVGSSAYTISISEARYSAELAAGKPDALPLPMVDFQEVAAVIQRRLGISGDSFAYNTACTAAANALMSAARMLQLGRYKHALVVGVELANQTTLAGFSGLQLVSKSLRPFDLNRSGIVLGEGIGAVVLSTLPGSHGCSLVGGASNCDTHSVTTANPDGSSIAALQVAVLEAAGIEASQVRAVKTHGTASPMNDTGEAAGLHRVFNPLPSILAFKSFTGHTLGACGVNELILLAGALKQGFLPGTPLFEHEDPLLNVTPNRSKAKAAPGFYLLNYFGFGGNNTALLIESHP